MKKKLILALALGLFLGSCQNSGTQPKAKSGTSEKKLTSQLSQPALACTSYSIYNDHGPTGPAVEYSYVDCNGAFQTGWLDPLQTINVLAQTGTVKCAGGVVTENGVGKKTDTEPSSKP